MAEGVVKGQHQPPHCNSFVYHSLKADGGRCRNRDHCNRQHGFASYIL